MNDWEQHANLSLQSLGEAYQRGHIDRGEFRARRRRILQGIRERHAQTQPNALQPTSHAAQPANAAFAVVPNPTGTAQPGSRRAAVVAVATCAIIAAGLIAWWWLRRGG